VKNIPTFLTHSHKPSSLHYITDRNVFDPQQYPEKNIGGLKSRRRRSASTAAPALPAPTSAIPTSCLSVLTNFPVRKSFLRMHPPGDLSGDPGQIFNRKKSISQRGAWA